MILRAVPRASHALPERIRRVSAAMAVACVTAAILLPVAVFWGVTQLPPEAVAAKLGVAGIDPGAWRMPLAAAVLAAPELGMSVALLALRGCFLGFRAGQFFSRDGVRGLQRFGGWAAGSVAAGLLATPIAALILTMGAAGGRQIVIQGSSGQLSTLFVAGMVWLVSWILERGMALDEQNAALAYENARLAEENAGFV